MLLEIVDLVRVQANRHVATCRGDRQREECMRRPVRVGGPERSPHVGPALDGLVPASVRTAVSPWVS